MQEAALADATHEQEVLCAPEAPETLAVLDDARSERWADAGSLSNSAREASLRETGGVSCCAGCACVCCEPLPSARRGNLTQEDAAEAVRQHRMIRPRVFGQRIGTMRAARF